LARTPDTGLGRRGFLRLALLGVGATALGRPLAASAHAGGAAELDGLAGLPVGIAMRHGRAVVVGEDDAGRAAVWWSQDGAPWTLARRGPEPGAVLGDVAAAAGGFVTVGSSSRRPAAWWSRDGSSWELASELPAPGHLVAVAASRRSVLAGGTRLDGEAEEGTGALLVSIDRSGAWGALSTAGIGDLAHGSITALARHGAAWVLAGIGTGAGGLWRATSSDRWTASPVPGREPVVWSSLLPLHTSLIALGTTVAGGDVRLARWADGRGWLLDAVPAALAALGADLRGGSLEDAAGTIVAVSATGAVPRLVAGATG